MLDLTNGINPGATHGNGWVVLKTAVFMEYQHLLKKVNSVLVPARWQHEDR
jgi:hypothetical protein